MENNHIKNLERYIREDSIYQEFLNGKSKNDFSDFDKFCIEHCEDIDYLLKLVKLIKKNDKEGRK